MNTFFSISISAGSENSRASKLLNPFIGILLTTANPLAQASPTRNEVNFPGPITMPIPLNLSGEIDNVLNASAKNVKMVSL